jgi:glycosyltransferase involved in cell wall biosynthesis
VAGRGTGSLPWDAGRVSSDADVPLRRLATPLGPRAPVKIAIVGTRGIPAAYGGFETLAWELSTHLAERGHEVTVYCRRGRTDESIAVPADIRRRFLPALSGKHLETVSHTGLSVLDSLFRGYDAMWLGNAANAVFSGVPRLRGTKVVLNVDGIERQRKKWGVAGRAWYAIGERLALVYPNAIVADADVIRDYYRERYGRESSVIAYGAPLLDRDPAPDLQAHGIDADVRPGRYFLYVSRLEPENQADLVIRAYRDVPGDLPLLVVGDAPYAAAFKAGLRELTAADPRVRLTGAIYGDGYRDLQRAALAYIQATSVGGTHPALVEAMGAGNLVIAFGTPENREVVAGCGLLFDTEGELTRILSDVVAGHDSVEMDRLRACARRRAADRYSWDAVTDAYLELWRSLGAG